MLGNDWLNTTVELKDYTDKIFSSFDKKVNAFLLEVKDSVSSQAFLNSPVDTAGLSRSFIMDSFIDKNEKTAYIGSNLKYSIYQEFGTGEYALEGNGRKGGWIYKSNKDGKFYKTYEVKPQRVLYRALLAKKPLIANQAKKVLETVNKNG